jgi:hypothetical protein
MGIRWLIVRGGDDPGPGWTESFRSGADVVYANPTVLPRAFVASAIAPPGTREAIITGLATATREQLAGTVFVLDVDREGLGTSLPVTTSEATRPITIISDAPDRQELSVPDGAAGIVVVTDTVGPGWTATVDGRPTNVVPVDLAFRGLSVPAGPHRVVLEYHPIASSLGLLLVVVAALGVAAWAVIARRRDRLALEQRMDASELDGRRS